MSSTITIAPVSRIEGHGRISIQLDDSGQVSGARLHVQEFRGFESFCVGRPFWEMPAIAARICGICPVSHALAAAQAGEHVLGLEIPLAARRLRTVLSLAQLLLSHSLSFFHLSAPDIVLGLDSDPLERNVIGLARQRPELIRNGVRLRQIGQEIVNRVAGGILHPEHVVIGGLRQPLSEHDRGEILALSPEAQRLVESALAVWEERREIFLAELGECGGLDIQYLGLVDQSGCLDYSGDILRLADNAGAVLNELRPETYGEAIRELSPGDSYMKPTECLLGGTSHYQVGALARVKIAAFVDSPQAERLRQEYRARGAFHDNSGYHPARLVEMLHAVERISVLLEQPDVSDSQVLAHGRVSNSEGIGVTEAPRGTLIHHYRVDEHGLLTGVNLIVATGHNSRAMDRTITAIAKRHLSGVRITEGLLNRVEHGIRLFDPCLSCATHLHGRLGMRIDLLDSQGKVLDSSAL
jgi:NAD-reducing hydrogenase large subunit